MTTTALLASWAFQAVLGFLYQDPAHTLASASPIDEFIAFESPTALGRLLCNIGPDGCYAYGVTPGVVVASPDKANPDYFYTWTRDAGLVMKYIVELFSEDYNSTLQTIIQDYVVSQAKLQTVENPSGSLADGSGLGEPKYNVDLTEYTDPWGRPQRDGPALRAIAMIEYSRWLIENGYNSTAKNVVWPVIANDLAYTGQYWGFSGFDLWEEVSGRSFFTFANQHRSLVQGNALAESLGLDCPACDLAPYVRCSLQTFWTSSGDYLVANIDTSIGRTGKDANTLLGSIHTFDPAAGCDSITFQPCSDRALANHKAVTDSFRSAYPINSGIPLGSAVSVGRYAEDVYFGGNPWYLTTLAAAEQLYDAIIVWHKQGYIQVTEVSLPFFKDLLPSITLGTYDQDAPAFSSLVASVKEYADGYLSIAAQYTQTNGSLSEQFSKSDGDPLSAYDLTWSYAAFLTAAARRSGVSPPSWGANVDNSLPPVCSSPIVVGSYSPVTLTSFPPSQTPTSVPQETTSIPATTTSRCAVATSVTARFEELVETTWGQRVKVVGDIDAMGDWNADRAVSLAASLYTSTNPLWIGTVELEAGQVIEYKYVIVGGDEEVKWEADPNHTYTVPASCATAVTVMDKWQ